jgi:hypothetical protein
LSYSLEEPSLPRKFISIFNQWVGKENLGRLDCRDESERAERDERLLAHWAQIFDCTPVYRIAGGTVRRETDRGSFLDACRNRPDKVSEDFAFVLLPELGAYYKEDWDDTNVVWYSDLQGVQPLFDWAHEFGLHVLDDWKAT